MGKVKAFIYWLHLWMGIATGIIVFVISITGSIYVFKNEIKDALEPWRFVEARDANYAPPSQLIDTAKTYVPGAEPTGLTFDGKKGAAAVGFWIPNNSSMDFKVVFMNPYSAEFIKLQEPLAKGNFNFFEFIERGHTRLWLPEKIGKPVVGISVIIFVLMLISGLIIWWPNQWTLTILKRRLSLNLSTNFKRLKYDLHHSLGMYALVFALIIALTGLTWSFSWFDHAVFYTLSGGETKAEHHHPHSNVSNVKETISDSIPAIDKAFYKALSNQANPERIFITPTLKDDDDACEIIMYKHKGKFYHHNSYFYDRYTLEPIRVKGDRYDDAIFAEKLNMMYYDIHTGAIWGFAGKIIVFLVGLICASLPVTGLIIWLNRYNLRQKH
ncbi:PepSY-associated TM helix domain-containing protein [Plebeiibacterium marinum]|uniref:PepSY domain-containing protein n=1 Tax=Plebeiibacterium marinum TaxID=2992111 RepID=A0AAE3SMJ7_9BACT|nr:PepSY-associated TM helix domain-containing protein [Plebeiobacterium marinum]MCW3807625.1 PepSY domain-containing protein [Plebeiobacterium marinum]